MPLQSTIIADQMTVLVVKARGNNFEEVTFTDALENLWKPLQDKIAEIVRQIDDGNVIWLTYIKLLVAIVIV